MIQIVIFLFKEQLFFSYNSSNSPKNFFFNKIKFENLYKNVFFKNTFECIVFARCF